MQQPLARAVLVATQPSLPPTTPACIRVAPVRPLPRPTCFWPLCVPPPRIPLQCIRWLGARGRVGALGALPTTLRGSCARSEEAPLRTGPEDLQELDSLDTEKSLLCGLGSG